MTAGPNAPGPADPAPAESATESAPADFAPDSAPVESATESAPADFAPSGNLRRRLVISRLVQGGATASAMVAVAVLGVVVFGVLKRGASAISLAFLTRDPPKFGGPGGGIASAILGTVMIVVLAAAIAVPIGVLTALYLTEFAGRRSRFAAGVKMALNLMQGLPTVVVGLFVFGLLVKGHGNSGFAGAVALSIVMLPLIARSSQEVLLLVPGSLREAADALGVSRWRTVIGLIVPAALSGIVTGSILAIARAAGETAPLLFVDSLYTPGVQLNLFGHAVPNIPVMIFTLSEADDPTGFARAWGAALVLLALILAANIGARVLLARSRARMTA
jgi:phosphate transport system permease protein